jgi:hypothetical protein
MSDEKPPTPEELEDLKGRINDFAESLIASGRARRYGTTPDGGVIVAPIYRPADPTGYLLKERQKP